MLKAALCVLLPICYGVLVFYAFEAIRTIYNQIKAKKTSTLTDFPPPIFDPPPFERVRDYSPLDQRDYWFGDEENELPPGATSTAPPTYTKRKKTC